MLKVDVKQLGVDAYVSSSHKWMLAPKGSGLLYINNYAQKNVDSVELSSGFAVYSASSGTRDVAQILAHGVAIQFHQAIGSQKIERRVRRLNRYLREKLNSISSLKPLTGQQEESSSGIYSVALDRDIASSAELAKRMGDEFNVRIKSTQSTFTLVPDSAGIQEDYNALRFSTHIFNSFEQIDDAVDALKRLLDGK